MPLGLEVGASSTTRTNIVPLVLQTCSGSTGRDVFSNALRIGQHVPQNDFNPFEKGKFRIRRLDYSDELMRRCFDVLTTVHDQLTVDTSAGVSAPNDSLDPSPSLYAIVIVQIPLL